CRTCHGFYGASSMERLPVEAALVEQTRTFKAITFWIRCALDHKTVKG
ncbi:MAG TPA: phosphoenolpyruvate hydrolase family protein, partial [Candidatus Omnitrophota bacterium]|nr:phosphoenolpyruvate hydrolase family protein [Candidatus Omnitrophota bacterium]